MAAQSAAPLVLFRLGTPEDWPFIFSSWLKSYAKASGVPGPEKPAYYRAQHDTVERLLARSAVVVACDPSAPGEVWGYCVYERQAARTVIHFCYVKQLFRRFGIGRELATSGASPAVMDCVPLVHSHRTEAGARLIQRFKSTYAPEAAT